MEESLYELSAAIAGIALEGESGSNAKSKHNPPQMPNEMWEKVFLSVEQSDIKNLRLAWRRWVDLGFRLLFRPFVFRPDRQDFDRLDRILEHGLPPGAINSLRFEYGTIDIRTMAQALGYEYMEEYNVQRIPDYNWHSGYSAQELEREITNAIREYASWVVKLHTGTRNIQSRMEAAFSKLDSLERFDMVYRGSPFKNDLLLNSWIQEIGGNNFGTTNRDFGKIIHSLLKWKSLLKHLSHDKLPVSYFVPECNRNFRLQPSIFTELQTLHLTFAATAAPHMKVWEHLGEFLQTAPSLKDLRLGFDSFDADLVEGSSWRKCDPNGLVDWYLPLWKFLGEYTWQQLAVLRSEGLIVCEKGLSEFLLRHCKTLRSLELNRIGLWQGSLQRLFSGVRALLKLDKFRILGMLHAFHHPDESWEFPPNEDGFPESWSPEYVFVMNDFTLKRWAPDAVASATRIRDFLVLFMQSTIDWPLKESGVEARHISHCPSEGCTMSMKDIDAHWCNGLMKPLKAWKDFRFRSGEQVNTGREIIESYSDDGYDDEGFDKYGYNNEGVHYRDAPYDFEGAVDPIHPSAAERETLANIVEAISEKAEVSEQICDIGGVWRRWISIGPKKM